MIICIRLWFSEMGGSTSLQFRIWWAYSKFYFSVSFKLSGLDHRKHMGTQEDIHITYICYRLIRRRTDFTISILNCLIHKMQMFVLETPRTALKAVALTSIQKCSFRIKFCTWHIFFCIVAYEDAEHILNMCVKIIPTWMRIVKT